MEVPADTSHSGAPQNLGVHSWMMLLCRALRLGTILLFSELFMARKQRWKSVEVQELVLSSLNEPFSPGVEANS